MTDQFIRQLNDWISEFFLFHPLLSDDDVDTDHQKDEHEYKACPEKHRYDPYLQMPNGIQGRVTHVMIYQSLFVLNGKPGWKVAVE